MKMESKSMAKKSDKKTTKRENYNEGCLSGLIRLFHFRKGRSNPKLLSGRKDQISENNGHGGTTKSGNKVDLPRHSKERNENINLGGRMNVLGKDCSNKDSNKEEIQMKRTAEKTSGYSIDTESKTKTVTSHNNKFGSNDSNHDSMFSQPLCSDLMVDLCKEEDTDSKKFRKHGDTLEKISSNMILKYFDPKQIKIVDAFQPNGFDTKISSSHALQQIVVLKPNKQHAEHGHSSRFTLKDIKRRMKGEDKIKPSSIKMDSLLHKIPYGSPKDMEQNKTATNTGQRIKLLKLFQRQEEEPHLDNSRNSISYDEGRKRLADMLHIDYHVHNISSPRQPPKSLGRVLSLPGFDSPSPMFSSRLSTQINDSSSFVSINMCAEATQPKALFDIKDGSKGKDDWIYFSSDELGYDSETCNEEETQNISDSPSKTLESIANNQEMDYIPLSIVEHVPDYDESIPNQRWLKHLKNVLEGSGLNYSELLDDLLDPSVFDELETKYGQLNIDSNVLLDYINEVSTEICMKFLRSTTSWISLIKPNIRPTPTKETFMQELCEGVERFIHEDFLVTVDQITQIDLKHEVWQDIRVDTEDVATEMVDVILDSIMEETVLEVSNSIQAFGRIK